MRTRGEGVRKSENFADIISGSFLTWYASPARHGTSYLCLQRRRCRHESYGKKERLIWGRLTADLDGRTTDGAGGVSDANGQEACTQ